MKSVGVIPAPEISKYQFQPDDAFVIMASDGVWEFISSQVWWSAPRNVDNHYSVTCAVLCTSPQEAVDIVQNNINKGAHYACQELIQTAAVRWREEEGDYRDDVSRGTTYVNFENSCVHRLLLLYSHCRCPWYFLWSPCSRQGSSAYSPLHYNYDSIVNDRVSVLVRTT